MTLQQLLYVVALDEHRQFVKAAEACHVTQPTVSMQLREPQQMLSTLQSQQQQLIMLENLFSYK